MTTNERIAAAFIRESRRPDVEPSMRFRVTMPDGTMRYHPTRPAAMWDLCEAIFWANAAGRRP